MKEFFANRKAAIDTGTARIQNIRVPMVDMVDRPQLTLLDLISRGQTGGNFEYVQVTGVNRGAGIVPENTGSDEDDTLKSSLVKYVNYTQGCSGGAEIVIMAFFQ